MAGYLIKRQGQATRRGAVRIRPAPRSWRNPFCPAANPDRRLRATVRLFSCQPVSVGTLLESHQQECSEALYILDRFHIVAKIARSLRPPKSSTLVDLLQTRAGRVLSAERAAPTCLLRHHSEFTSFACHADQA
jgi:hypothetical protein